jgi:hypothetical protein
MDVGHPHAPHPPVAAGGDGLLSGWPPMPLAVGEQLRCMALVGDAMIHGDLLCRVVF